MAYNILPEHEKQLRLIADAADGLGVSAYLVGGYVRDLLLKRPCKDIDVVCVGSGIELAKAAAKKMGYGGKVAVYKNFGTAAFHLGGLSFEFVGARKESYRKDSRKPLVENGTLEDDQNRRDFTINALALNLGAADFGELLDPFGGLQDLEKGIIRTPLDPDITFSDDPLRMMRAVRFAAQLNFKIAPATFAAIPANNERLKIISKERIADELNKIMLSPRSSYGIRLLSKGRLLQHILPELETLRGVEERMGKSHKDNFHHTLQVLDNICESSGDLWLRWAALLHDVAKPQTKRFDKEQGWTFHGHEVVGARMVPRIFNRLKLPMGQPMKFVQKMVALHLRPIALTKGNVTDSGIRRLLFDAGDDIDSLMLLCQADITSKNEFKVKRYLKNYKTMQRKLVEVEEKDRLRNWQPPISGELIMETFGLKPSKTVGIVKTAIREAILDGEIPNQYETAYTYMLEKGAELGLAPLQRVPPNQNLPNNMIIPKANRLANVEEYYFSRKLSEIRDMDAAGNEVINLGIGSPDGAPSGATVSALCQTAMQPHMHGYQSYVGLPQLRQAMADWYRRTYGVTLNPDGEVLPLMGSKEGIMHISMAFLNPGDKVLVPDPGYLTYASVSRLLGAETVQYNLDGNNGWQPDWEQLEKLDTSGVKLMWCNYPNMPTGADASPRLFRRLVQFAAERELLLVNDNPYSLVLNPKPQSILQHENAFEVALELNSLSKSHNMAGWRVGMLVGRPDYLKAVLQAKSNMDSGMFAGIQLAAAAALGNAGEWHAQQNAVYAERRVLAMQMAQGLGCQPDSGQVGMFVWAKTPESIENVEVWVDEMLQKARVFITPGFIFGENGGRYIRISLCATTQKFEEAARRLQAAGFTVAG